MPYSSSAKNMMFLLVSISSISWAFIPQQTSSISFTSCSEKASPSFLTNGNQPPFQRSYSRLYSSKVPPGGIDFEVDEESTQTKQSATGISMSDTKLNSSNAQPLQFQNRGKVNEIDFCMAPSDVSLSRSYQSSNNDSNSNQSTSAVDLAMGSSPAQQPRILSLTRALNNASNRAVRRILLSRSWPSAEALNLSLRQLLASKEGETTTTSQATTEEEDAVAPVVASKDDDKNAKCPVPRPILNIIVRQSKDTNLTESETLPITESNMSSLSSTPSPLTRMKLSDEQWVDEQMKAFRETYGSLPGYEYADAYMECILSLATSGVESERVSEVIAGGVYDDSYRRLIAVLRTAGAAFESDNGTVQGSRMKIARKLIDQDICLSMLDKLSIKNEKNVEVVEKDIVNVDEVRIAQIESTEEKEKNAISEDENSLKQKDGKVEPKKKSRNIKDRFLFFMKKDEDKSDKKLEKESDSGSKSEDDEILEKTTKIKPEDLGGVLLSAEEPTVTRQLNVLSNIVQRALLFGGEQELLVLSQTLEADKEAFIKRWYPNSVNDIDSDDIKKESRPGVQFFNCLVQLLKDSYTYGVVTDLEPPYPLSSSYGNSYGRLTAFLVELGSGYIKPVSTKKQKNLPKTAKDELIRFSQWETSLRQIKPDVSDYPSDLIGSWQVKDEIGGKIIGTSTVIFKQEGEVYVDPPLRGLRWRLDPGPTHLDTCTFQVLNEDGAVIQYIGFLDRGARLESRFSKRPVKIRGAVTFQMRDGETALLGDDYKRDMLPIGTTTGTTRFVMSKVFDF